MISYLNIKYFSILWFLQTYQVFWRVQELDDVHRSTAIDHDDSLHLTLDDIFIFAWK